MAGAKDGSSMTSPVFRCTGEIRGKLVKLLHMCRGDATGVDDDDYLGFLDTHFELTRFKAR